MSETEKPNGDPDYRLPTGSRLRHAWKISALVGVIGLVLSIVGAFVDAHRFAFAWLFAFMTFLAIALGALFFVLGQHLTGAGWGVTVRRTAELLASGLPLFAFLFLPIAFSLHALYPWMEIPLEEPPHHEGGDPTHGAAQRESLDLGSRAHAQDPRELHDAQPGEWEHATGSGAHGAPRTPQEQEHEHLVAEKRGYFHLGGRAVFFLIRAVIYFIAWTLLSYLFVSWSTRQDQERGVELTRKMQRLAPPATFVFGLTLTFAAFDWMMSMEPTWYSTIYGVLYFAISAMVAHAVIILLTLAVRRFGNVNGAINVEHYHDLGKLLFGFTVFWAYIGFSQYMLIWYAGIPEEATYYHLRWTGGGGYAVVSIFLVLGGFAVPFFLLMSRHAKRRLPLLIAASVWVALAHVVQMHWMVTPYAEQYGLVHTRFSLHWLDFTALFAVGGLYFAFVLWQMTRVPLVPIGDPRLPRALAFENA
jgi:hypothetical protein